MQKQKQKNNYFKFTIVIKLQMSKLHLRLTKTFCLILSKTNTKLPQINKSETSRNYLEDLQSANPSVRQQVARYNLFDKLIRNLAVARLFANLHLSYSLIESPRSQFDSSLQRFRSSLDLILPFGRLLGIVVCFGYLWGMFQLALLLENTMT